MNFKNEFANFLYTVIDKDSGFDISTLENTIAIPPSLELGNFAFPVFTLSKIYKKAPDIIAQELLESLNKIDQDVFSFSFVGGYLNAKIKTDLFFKITLTTIMEQRDDYGRVVKCTPTSYVIDTFNVNPLKALHVGHLRNAIVGDVVSNLISFTGDQALPISYGGDIGTHVARFYWYYSNFVEDKNIPEENVSKWFGNIYISATKLLAENPDYKKDVDVLQSKLIDDKSLQEEIELLTSHSKKANLKVKDELGIDLVHSFYESESEKEFLKIKDSLFLEHSSIFKESEGATIVDFSEEDLGVLVLIKNNNALLYPAKDIGLVKIKQRFFPLANNFLYVVGSEQDFYFRQLFKLYNIIYPSTNHQHISHGLVNLSSGKMASREGGSILYEDFRDLLFERTRSILEENHLEFDNEIVKDISFGTMRFEMLKVGVTKTIVFDINKALDLTGDSAVYVQYTGVRANSIFKKTEESVSLEDLNVLDFSECAPEEESLLNLLNFFPEKVLEARKDFRPHVIVNYVLEISRAFNKFYGACQVLHSDEKIKKKRLLLTKAYMIVLTNACSLLGINIPEKM